MTDMVHGPVALAPSEPVLPRWWRTVDKWSLAAAIALFAIGLLLGLAASVPLAVRNGLGDFHYVSRQAVFGGVAFMVMIWLSLQPLRQVRRLAVLGFVAAAIAVLLLPVLGTDFNKGATRWYSLGFMSLQPSEFLKPGFVVFTAWLMAASFEVNGPPGRLLSFLTAVFFTLVLCLQPDFGQASLILGAWGLMYFVAGANLFLLVALAALVMGAGFVAYSNSEHVARRIDGYLSPDVDPNTQLGYATNAIQEGGFLGVGVGEGTVKWALPDAHTDFIVAVAAEEYGLLLCLVIIGLYLLIALRALFRLIKERDPFVRLAGTGLAGLLALQAFINMGVAVRLLPAKGMTLPFISYGGSSLVAAGITMGLLLALTRNRPQAGLGDVIGRVR